MIEKLAGTIGWRRAEPCACVISRKPVLLKSPENLLQAAAGSTKLRRFLADFPQAASHFCPAGRVPSG